MGDSDSESYFDLGSSDDEWQDSEDVPSSEEEGSSESDEATDSQSESSTSESNGQSTSLLRRSTSTLSLSTTVGSQQPLWSFPLISAQSKEPESEIESEEISIDEA